MRIVKPKFEIVEQGEGFKGIEEIIEKAGRTCYKSEDRIKDGTAEKFVSAMVKNGHTAMLEHGTVYLTIPWETYPVTNMDVMHYLQKPASNYSEVTYSYDEKNNVKEAYVTTNYRVIVENNLLDDLKYLTEPTEKHAKRICVRFWMDRVGTQSSERHRVFSFAQESTRFCNYSKEKFGEHIKISQPHFISDEDVAKMSEDDMYDKVNGVHEEYFGNSNLESDIIDYWYAANSFSEWCYMKMIDKGLNPEDARSVLPLDIDSEMVMTGFIKDWKHWLDLRSDNKTGKAHPDINKLAQGLKKEFISRGYLD